MTDKELIDAFVAGELDEAGMAQLEAELRAHPELVRELADQHQMEQALQVLLGDDTADQQVTVSVLSVLRADPIDSFKVDLLAQVKQQAEIRRREEEAAKVPVLPAPPPAPIEAKPSIEFVPPTRVSRRRVLPWVVAGSIAAAGLLALGVTLFSPKTGATSTESNAFLRNRRCLFRFNRNLAHDAALQRGRRRLRWNRQGNGSPGATCIAIEDDAVNDVMRST